MRRAAMAFLIVGLTFGEMVSGPGGQPVAEAASLAVAASSVTSAVWPNGSRAKQYQGNKVVKVGGISLSIDADMVAGPVVRK